MRRLAFVIGATLLASLPVAPAHAATFLFELSGARNATFQLDDTPDATNTVLTSGDSIIYRNVSGVFGGVQGTATSISLGRGVLAPLNISAPGFGFAQFGTGGPLFTGTLAMPVIRTGSFRLGSLAIGGADLRITEITAAVPEPATWAMMLLGFGAVGYSMRKRRVTMKVSYAV